MPAPRAFPLLPLLGAAALVLTALTLVRMGYEMGLFERTLAPAGEPVTFRNIPLTFQPQQSGGITEPQTVRLVPRSTSLTGGSATTGLTLFVLTDPACGPCRARVDEVFKTIPKNIVRVVQLYWPENSADISGGMALELARRANILPRFMSKLSAQRESLDAEQMLEILASAGLPLNEQRQKLAANGAEIAELLESDMAQIRGANLPPPPQFVLQNVLLDGRVLSVERLPLYIRRLRQNETLVQPDDYWLNPGI